MKKFIAITILTLATSMNVFATSAKEFFGKWRNGNVQIEIQKDTIFIDEIGNEGFGYTYTYDAQKHTFKLFDTFGQYFMHLLIEKSAQSKGKANIKIYWEGTENIIPSETFIKQ